MIWPPVKAWSSKTPINGYTHFVAINYGGKLLKRWVILMSVLDSSVVVKVAWAKIIDSSHWECGWNEINYLHSYELINNSFEIKNNTISNLSIDSGLTIPINTDSMRPWFYNT